MELLTSLKPERQSVDAAIQVVCDRLEHATLLEDRRAGVLSLKGFAREYKEAVTAGGLRGLLKSLTVDREDEETLKATLECLLLLFRIRDTEVIDDTALWIADEFTLRPEHVFSLLDIASEPTHYTRLHAIQILACILECRQTQLQECVASSPTGVGVLVGVLDDAREVIRFEVLLLLIKLTKGHQDIQKRVAFENVFDKVKTILDGEGGLEGGVATADCLLLLHNLLEENVSNQNWFRETEFFKTVSQLLQGLDKTSATTYTKDVVRNCIGTMSLVRLFVKRDQSDRKVNQTAFMKAGVLTQIVAYAFQPAAPADLRAEALLGLSDLLFEHADAQQYFVKASNMLTGRVANGHSEGADDLAPLMATLLSGASDDFILRHAASLCIYSFATGDAERKLGVVQGILDGFEDGERPNLIQALIDPVAHDTSLDTWFAACMLLQLTQGDSEARALVCGLTIGDSEAGEEEITLIQTVSSNLIVALARNESRALSGYLMLLSSWLFDAKDNVADLLGESSTLQALLSCVQDASATDVVRGLAATLVSIMYAFDFAEETPMNRTHLQPAILRVGRTLIQRSIHRLSSLEDMYDASLILRPLSHPLLHPTFCDFFRDEYGTIRRAVEQRPQPPLTQAQVEGAATERYIAELQEQLDFKSNGLNEAINHLRSRQEELSRVREELTFLKGKQERDGADGAKVREELAASKERVVEMQKTIDGLRAELAAMREELRGVGREHEVAKGVVEKLQQENASQSSMRQFVESQLGSLRKDKDASDKRLDELSRRCKAAEDAAEAADAKGKEDGRRLTSLNEELAKLREASKRAEEEKQSFRTQLRDVEQELKGERIQLESQQRAHDRDLKMQRDRREEAEAERDRARSELAEVKKSVDNKLADAVKASEAKLAKEHDKLLKSADDKHAAAIKKLETALNDAKHANAKSLADKTKQHDAAIVEHTKAHEKALASLRADHEARITEIEAKARAESAKVASEGTAATEVERAKLDAQLAAANEARDASDKTAAQLRKELDSTTKQLTLSKSMLEKALRDKQSLTEAADAASSATKSAAANGADDGDVDGDGRARSAAEVEALKQNAELELAKDAAVQEATTLRSELAELSKQLDTARSESQTASKSAEERLAKAGAEADARIAALELDLQTQKQQQKQRDETLAKEPAAQSKSNAKAADEKAAADAAQAAHTAKDAQEAQDAHEAALRQITAERDDLKKQLEQAQEDLMLLMEAEEDDAT